MDRTDISYFKSKSTNYKVGEILDNDFNFKSNFVINYNQNKNLNSIDSSFSFDEKKYIAINPSFTYNFPKIYHFTISPNFNYGANVYFRSLKRNLI